MKYTEKDIKEGTKLRCTKARPSWWTLEKLYNVSLNDDGILQITDDNGHCAYLDYMLDCLNGNHSPVSFEIVEEEKEMTKYVEITKLIDWSRDPELLEVGKVYKVVEEYKDMLYIKGVSIYVNEREESYYLRSDQFKFVEQNEEEKEELPELKAKADLKEVIQAKIEQLRTDAEIISNKRNRMEWQMFNLNSKANKLEEVLETIKEFE